MRRLLFILTLGVYGFSAMDLREWARVPQVLVHLLEHHSDFGHHHDDPTEHRHNDQQGHNPFSDHQHEACGSMSLVSLPGEDGLLAIAAPDMSRTITTIEVEEALASYSGSKWNPPKQV